MSLRRALKLAPVYLGTALGTFLIAGAVMLMWQRTRTLSYCTVARDAQTYHGQVITIRARAIFGSRGIYLYEDCDPTAALVSLVELDGAPHVFQGPGYVEEVLVERDQTEMKQADVIISGRFDGEYSMGCWSPAFHIAATRIELVSPLTDVPVNPSSDSGLRTKH
jgi:hypothetical protein